MSRFSLLLPAVIFALLVPTTHSRAQQAFFEPAIQAKDIEASLGTDWYGVYLKDKKIGYCKTVFAKNGDTVVESFAITMKLAAFDKKVELKMSRSLTFEAKPPYRLLAGTYEQDDGGSATKHSAKRNDKGFELTATTLGKDRTRQVKDLGYNLPASIATDIWLRGAPKVGDQINSRSFDLKDWKENPTKHTLKNIKNTLVGGVDVKYFEVESENQADKIKFLSRFDGTGKMLSSDLAGVFELRRESEEQAKNTEFSSDLFVLGMVKIDRKIGHTTSLTELVIEVKGVEAGMLTNGPMQTVVAKDGEKSSVVKLGKKHANEMKVTKKEIEENLAETNDYVISDPKIKELAKEAIKDAKTDAEKAKRIVAFAHNYIKPTAVATLPNIHTLLEKKQGDCKCYSLLVVNLCRAAGVPCREVAGLVYMGDDAKAFGGHAWNEIAIDGVWVPVDATLNQMSLDAGHISFGDMRSASGQILNSVGKMSFKVLDSQTSK